MMGSARIHRTITRIACQIHEDTRGEGLLQIYGINSRGYQLAVLLAEQLGYVSGTNIQARTLDVKHKLSHDLNSVSSPEGQKGSEPSELPEPEAASSSNLRNGPDRVRQKVKQKRSDTDKKIILMDDVIYSGQTMFQALQMITSVEQPSEIKLSALIDRGHRLYPIDIQYLGLYCPTKLKEHVHCSFTEKGEPDGVWLYPSI